MNTNEKLIIKEEAATTADLSQQEPHLKVVDVMPSVVTSDEERLAAGISTIGLQTKRHSGAQRKRLTRERKMREGTWMEKKPPGKAPSTESKDGAGGSGGVKTPPLRLEHTTLGKKEQVKNLGTLRCRLGRTKRLLSESRWRLFTDTTLTSNWIKFRST